MNSWYFNSNAMYWLKHIIAKGLNISIDSVYREVKSIEKISNYSFYIHTKDGKTYEFELKEVIRDETVKKE